MDGTYRTYGTYRGHRRKSPIPEARLSSRFSPVTFHLSPRSALVQQDAIKCGRDTRFGAQLSAPILWDGVDPQVRA
jgi:hypothetical protein